jgi:hypothetical protein
MIQTMNICNRCRLEILRKPSNDPYHRHPFFCWNLANRELVVDWGQAFGGGSLLQRQYQFCRLHRADDVGRYLEDGSGLGPMVWIKQQHVHPAKPANHPLQRQCRVSVRQFCRQRMRLHPYPRPHLWLAAFQQFYSGWQQRFLKGGQRGRLVGHPCRREP